MRVPKERDRRMASPEPLYSDVACVTLGGSAQQRIRTQNRLLGSYSAKSTWAQ